MVILDHHDAVSRTNLPTGVDKGETRVWIGSSRLLQMVAVFGNSLSLVLFDLTLSTRTLGFVVAVGHNVVGGKDRKGFADFGSIEVHVG